MAFVDVVIRQAHPGEQRHHYDTYEQKVEGAREYAELDDIPWPVLVDDYAGTVHRTYSREMADPSFLIDPQGRVAFYGMWTHVPTLKRAIDELRRRGPEGPPVAGGVDRMPHLFASIVDGYRGPRRGGRRGVLEYDLGAVGSGSMSFLGNKLKPLLGRFALRAAPRGDQAPHRA